jgi:glycosyltransferase involved in cell wall biosynthesis
MRILWLASWYPSILNPLNGDFIKRHAQAASLYNDIDVIFVEKDSEGTVARNVHIEETHTKRLTEKIIYYHYPDKSSFVDKLRSTHIYKQCFKDAIEEYITKHGKPGLVHLHVTMKAGIIARWIKNKYEIPYVLTEHWAGYLPEAEDKLSNYPLYYRILVRRIFENAAAVSVVSKYLGEHIKSFRKDKSYTVIPNVVDTTIFKPAHREDMDIIRFVHISRLDHQKNPEAILRAFAIVQKTFTRFRLDVFGPDNPGLKKLALELGLNQYVNFCPEVSQPELCRFLQQSHALLLYSRFETFGCVIIEANACGIPVIVSGLEVFRGLVEEGVNGVVAGGNNPAVLSEKILWFMQNIRAFDSQVIATGAITKYSYPVVGKQFHDWYEMILKKETGVSA